MYYDVVTARGVEYTPPIHTRTHTRERERERETEKKSVCGVGRRTCSARVLAYLRFSRGGLS